MLLFVKAHASRRQQQWKAEEVMRISENNLQSCKMVCLSIRQTLETRRSFCFIFQAFHPDCYVSQKWSKQRHFISTFYNGDGYWWSSSSRRCVGPITLVQRALLRPQLCNQRLVVVVVVGDGKGRWSSSHRGSSSSPDAVSVARGGRVRRSVGIWNARHGIGILCPRPSPQPRPTERWSNPFQRRPKSHVMRCLWRWRADILGRWRRRRRRSACR